VVGHHHRKVRLLFALADVALVVLAFEAAYQSRQWLPLDREFFIVVETKALLVGLSMLVWPVVALWLAVYDRLDSGRPRIVLRDSLRQCITSAVIVVLIQFALRLDLSRLFLALFAVYAWALIVVFRLNAGRLVRWVRSGFGGAHYVLVVGTGDRALALGRSLEASARYGIRLVGFLENGPASHVTLEKEHPVHPLDRLSALLDREIVDEVIFCVDGAQLAGMEDLLLLCDQDGVRTHVAVDFFPHVHSEVYLDRLEQVPLLTFAAAPNDEILLFAKRTIDILLAVVSMIVLSPLLLLVAAGIRISSPGPVIFRQVRCGLNGRRFVFYKFRSMVFNAEALRAQIQHLNRKEIAFKIPDDPRLTWLGRYLRRFSLDELPQLWNVLRGDMSLVGPRPAVPEEVERYQRWQRRRLRMRPGLTCLWALDGRDHLDFESWMKKDMEYIDNWSLGLDWKIMALTIPRVLSGRGAH
jgi:exopolysaccharide biosynthesis polyprenyl glycosylphosphotransferase